VPHPHLPPKKNRVFVELYFVYSMDSVYRRDIYDKYSYRERCRDTEREKEI